MLFYRDGREVWLYDRILRGTDMALVLEIVEGDEVARKRYEAPGLLVLLLDECTFTRILSTSPTWDTVSLYRRQ